MSTVMPRMLSAVIGLAVCTAVVSTAPAEARGFRAAGSRGAAGGFTRQGQYGNYGRVGGVAYGRGAAGAAGGRWAGPNGGSFAGAGGGFATPNAGLVGGAFNGTGPNGGTAQGAGAAGWKRGVGGFGASKMSATGAGGSTYNGYKQGLYNAQTGQGTYASGKDVYNAKNGQSYGYDQDTSFTKGQGANTSLDTQNHGDYAIDWSKGAKPVVTPVPAVQ